MYYAILDFSIVDFAVGLEDIKAGVIRMIGDPELRYREDPVRMLRAVRIASKLKFRLDKDTAAPIRSLAPLLREILPARLFDEVIKLLQCRYSSVDRRVWKECVRTCISRWSPDY